MMKQIIMIMLMLILIPTVSAEHDETKIILNIHPTDVKQGEIVYLEGQLLYTDGSEITVEHMDYVLVGIYINGKIDTLSSMPVKLHCNATGHFGGGYIMDSTGETTFKAVFDGKTTKGLTSSESMIYTINVDARDSSGGSTSGLVKFIGYAKGFFALVFFGVLSVTIGTGCYSAALHDPQKKAGAQESLFSLLKILGTVTCVYMTVLFLASV